MDTKEMRRASQTEEDINRRALTMALAILVERIQSLSKEDREDLYGLLKELPRVEDDEELCSIVVTMEEILDQKPIRLEKVDQDEEFQPEGGLRRWVDFVSTRIKDLRTRAGLTQDQLAEASGLPQSHISRLEGGKHSPSRITLEKLAKALHVGVEVFDPSA